MKYLTIISNFIYLLCGLYLLYKKHYLYGIIAIFIWLISHIYHTDKTKDNLWGWKMNMDIFFSSIFFIILLIKCRSIILCIKNITLLFIVFILFIFGWYYYYVDMKKHYIFHSLWHIASALYILYIIILLENNKLI
jgi:hypothetical protein